MCKGTSGSASDGFCAALDLFYCDFDHFYISQALPAHVSLFAQLNDSESLTYDQTIDGIARKQSFYRFGTKLHLLPMCAYGLKTRKIHFTICIFLRSLSNNNCSF